METASLYQTAWTFHMKGVLAIRGISNLLNMHGGDDNIAESDVDGSMEAATAVLWQILHKLIETPRPEALNIKQSSLIQSKL